MFNTPSVCVSFRSERVWREASALQTPLHEHARQLQVLLRGRVCAAAGRQLQE